MKISLEILDKEKKKNLEERFKFIKFWAEYIKKHKDRDWSNQQKILIDSQICSTP